MIYNYIYVYVYIYIIQLNYLETSELEKQYYAGVTYHNNNNDAIANYKLQLNLSQ